MSEKTVITYLESPLGTLAISGSKNGIRSVLFDAVEKPATKHPALLAKCCRQLNEYFAGKRDHFDIPLDPAGTDFQRRIWQELQKIPFGETITYLELAQRIGDVKAIRAAGHANGQNKITIIVPCHRVIGAGGKLTGYGGGLWRKEWLLKHEAALRMPGLFGNPG